MEEQLQNQEPEKDKPWIKIVLVALGILILAVALLLFFFKDPCFNENHFGAELTPECAASLVPKNSISPATDLTESWQTYRNEEYGFEFKYPKEWMIKNIEEKGVFYTGVWHGGSHYERFAVESSDKPISIRNAVEKYDKSYGNQQLAEETWSVGDLNIKISGLDTEIYYTLTAKHNEKFFRIRIDPYYKEDWHNINQILSTFKFVEYNPLSSTAWNKPLNTTGWKIYKNEQYGFEFKYPDTYHVVTEMVEDVWPKAIILLECSNSLCQTYRLSIELRDTNEVDKYSIQKSFLGKQAGDKYIILTNINMQEDIDQIISTFKFTK